MSAILLGLHRPTLKLVFKLAIPNIISNITIPLLSLVDVTLAGHMDYSAAIGGVTIASGITNTLYWLFGFLRFGTTGLVAQAYGRSSVSDICTQLGRSIFLGIICSLLLLTLSWPVISFAGVMAVGNQVMTQDAADYMRIIFMGAPATMGIYVLNGFFIGMQNTKSPMIAAISANIINIALSVLLVRGYHLGVAGLAIGTTAAQYSSLAILIVLALRKHGRVLRFLRPAHLIHPTGMGYFLRLGLNLMIRSALLSAVMLFFTYGGTVQGEVAVAANALLMQFFSLFSYFMDGFAYAGEALSGRYYGMHRSDLLLRLIRNLMLMGTFFAVGALIIYLLFPEPILGLLSNDPGVVGEAMKYRYWIALVPLTGFTAFIWDGINVGITCSRELMFSMVVATPLFFLLYFTITPVWPGHALWLAFNAYLLSRGIVQEVLFHTGILKTLRKW